MLYGKANSLKTKQGVININDNVLVKIDGLEVYRGNKVCTSYKSVGNRTKVEYSNNFFCNNPEYIITDKKIEIETIK